MKPTFRFGETKVSDDILNINKKDVNLSATYTDNFGKLKRSELTNYVSGLVSKVAEQRQEQSELDEPEELEL